MRALFTLTNDLKRPMYDGSNTRQRRSCRSQYCSPSIRHQRTDYLSSPTITNRDGPPPSQWWTTTPSPQVTDSATSSSTVHKELKSKSDVELEATGAGAGAEDESGANLDVLGTGGSD